MGYKIDYHLYKWIYIAKKVKAEIRAIELERIVVLVMKIALEKF